MVIAVAIDPRASALPPANLLQAKRIGLVDRIAADIAIQVHARSVTDRIGLKDRPSVAPWRRRLAGFASGPPRTAPRREPSLFINILLSSC